MLLPGGLGKKTDAIAFQIPESGPKQVQEIMFVGRALDEVLASVVDFPGYGARSNSALYRDFGFDNGVDGSLDVGGRIGSDTDSGDLEICAAVLGDDPDGKWGLGRIRFSYRSRGAW